MQRKILAAAAAACLAVILGCNVSASLKRKYYEEGIRHAKAGRHREASIAFRKAVQKDAEFGEGYYRLGLSELEPGGDPQRAVAALRRASVLLPYNEDAKAKLAEIYIAIYLANAGVEKFPIEEARRLADLLLARNPNSYEGLRLSGHIAVLEKRPKDAIERFRKADAVKPGNAEVRVALAQALAEDNQDGAARKLLSEVLARDKTCAPAYDLLYLRHMAAKRTAEAEAVLKAKAAALPGDGNVLLQLAGHYFRTQNKPAMQSVLDRLSGDAKAFPQGRLMAGDFHRSTGSLAEARRQYEAGTAAAIGSGKLEYDKRLANLLLLEGKREEAMQAYEGITKQIPKDAESRETRAALLLEKDVDSALKELKTLAEENPSDPALRYNLGQAYLAKRDFEQARISFLEASRRQRTFLLPRIALAQMSLEANRFKDVAEYASDILAINPDSPEGRYFRCAAMVGLGNYSDARRELNKLRQEYPNYPEVTLQIAFVDLSERRFADAEKNLHALYEQTRDVRALNGLVDVYLAQEQKERAVQAVADELKRHPESQRIRLLVAQTALRLKNFPLAIEHFVALAEVDPNWPYLYLRIGEAYQFSGDLERAVTAFRKARQLDPKGLEPALRLAYALEVAGEVKDAMAAYREVLKLNPNVPIAMNNLAFLLAEHGGDLDEALRYAQAALQRLPQQQHISDTIGWITLHKKQPDAAMQIFASLVRKYPEDTLYRYHLAMACFEKGDRARAKGEAQAALERKPPPGEEKKIRSLLARLQ